MWKWEPTAGHDGKGQRQEEENKPPPDPEIGQSRAHVGRKISCFHGSSSSKITLFVGEIYDQN